MQLDVPREPAPLPIPAFLHPAFVWTAAGSATPMKPATLTSLTLIKPRIVGLVASRRETFV